MYAVERYAAVRRFVLIEGHSRREAALVFGLHRDTVAKMCGFSEPPGYRRSVPPKKPKLDPFIPIIDAILEADREAPRKQRHTAKRIFEGLREECGFDGGYTIVKDYMRERDRRGREMFVPLAHPPGHAQADFGEAFVFIDGVEQKAHFFVMDLPHSDACFVRAYPAATAEAWVDGHVHAFAFFGKVPLSVLYDNDRCLVSKILPDGTRQRATLFNGFLSHYLFRDRYGRPGKGNDKGAAEGLVGYSRRNFMVPIPRFATWEAFNAYLEDHAYLLEALLALYEATFEPRWYEAARGTAATMIERFGDEARGGFFTTSDDHEQLIARRKDLDDHPIPSGNASAALGLLRLEALSGERRWGEWGEGVLRLLARPSERHPEALAYLLTAADFHLSPTREVALIGPAGADRGSIADLERAVRARYRPHLVLAGGIEGSDQPALLADRPALDGGPAAYVCERFSCQAPVSTPEGLGALLD